MIKSIKNIIIFLITISCVGQETIDALLYQGDPLEKSAFLKKENPWFARYQVGESPVVGFPGETKNEKKQRMQKWVDAKYGLFIHWGPQRAGGEYEISSEVSNAFNPVDFNAKEWVSIAKRLGFKYIVITAKHHAGFSMFDSKLTDFNIIEKTPFKRDPIKELAIACTEENMPFGVYYSVWDIHHPDYTKNIGSKNYVKYHEFMLGQVKELLTNYGPMISVWFDGEWVNSWTVERATEFRDLIRAVQPNTVIANRIGQRRRGEGDHHSPENFSPYIGAQSEPWETCAKFDGSWFYNGTNKSESADWALYNLCYATSRGGNFLMNLGPTPEGKFLETSVEKLEKVGNWLQINRESIYGSDKGPHYLLEWGTCTQKGNTLYYQVFDWPKNGELHIPGLKTAVKSASFLADKAHKSITTNREGNDVVVKLPIIPPYKMANVIKIELMDTPIVDNAARALKKEIKKNQAMRQVAEGSYFLPAGFANIYGEKLHFYYGTGSGAQRENLKGWTEESDYVTWDLLVEKNGKYNLEITYASLVAGGAFELFIAGQNFKHTVKEVEYNPKAKKSPLRVDYKTFTLGEVVLKSGRYQLVIKPIEISEEAKKLHQGLMMLRDVTLVPN
ncbi:alpha-L-fucosidase [Polaribacter sp. KT25b]|uniref:alpha-L-fucosidase n=1 Tax=Polaribacter sp. KT25b TaxID=1855336 RepID=UPI00087CCD46|nr:alpha-L-fucosidase [Polaribacter sp. KT25b]SDR65393.1 alpha-L-fucosidase [Polaribacter sp. KT25b]